MTFLRIRESVRSSLWFMPLVLVVAAVLLWAVLREVDHRYDTGDWPLAFGGSPAGAQEVLSAVVSSIITFTAVVFSITIVALQLASQQFTPRVLRTFLRDRTTQVTLGLFIATLTYSLLVLREIRLPSDEQDPYVPNVAVAGALVVLGLTLAAFVRYLHHVAQSIRVVNIIDSVARETRQAIDRVYPDEPDHDPRVVRELLPEPAAVLAAPRPGVVLAVSYDRVAKVARRHAALVEVVPTVGQFVAAGQPIVTVRGGDGIPEDELLDAVGIGRERTMHQDPEFGFRQLVDIACRALSPGVNDPTTAVQCLDQLHDLLRRLVLRPARSGEILDEDDDVRVLIPRTGFERFLTLALEEIEHYGGEEPQVQRRIQSMLTDLLSCAPAAHLPAIRAHLVRVGPAPDRDLTLTTAVH